jgi:hypothetical protein
MTPSTMLQLAAPPGGDAVQVPTLWPAAIVQVPVQQSLFCAQMSPPWPHHDDGWHVLPAHRLEQQSALFMHALPRVLQLEGSGTHVPLHVWLQHCDPLVQVCPSDRQAG